jgi:secreted trypsin-like serine protease
MNETIAAIAWPQWGPLERFNSSLVIEVSRPNGVFTCSGVALSRDLILTAAHCLDGEVINVRVFLGSEYRPKNPSYTIKNYQLHYEYNSSQSRCHSDLAKINMKKKLPANIKFHKIYTGNQYPEKFYRLGFGGRNNQNIRTLTTPILRKIDIEEEIIELNDENSYSGDSGGPIFMQSGNKFYLVAIHSTFSFGPEGKFSLNPLLTSYIPWIYGH